MRIRVAVFAVVLSIVSYELRATGNIFDRPLFSLEMQNQHQEILQSVEGGTGFGDVIEEQGGSLPYVKKHLGDVGYEDIIIEVAPTPGSELFAWIDATLAGDRKARRSGAIVAYGSNLMELGRVVFSDAAITEISFPAADGNGSAVLLRIRINPGQTESQSATGQRFQGGAQSCSAPLSSAFRLAMNGLDTSGVGHVDSIVITIPRIDQARVATKIDYPELSVMIAASRVTSWNEWYEDFVLQGDNGDPQERTGSLTFLARDLSTPLLEVNFTGVGIFRLAQEPSAGFAQWWRADLYVEQMTVTGHPCP